MINDKKITVCTCVGLSLSYKKYVGSGEFAILSIVYINECVCGSLYAIYAIPFIRLGWDDFYIYSSADMKDS